MSFYDYQGNIISENFSLVSDVLLQNNLISHRGWSGAPENTMPAIEEAVANGYKHIEVDLNWTSDGVCVLLHDNTIDRTSNGSGNIGSMTYSQASQYDFGSWKGSAYTGTKIPTLREALLYCKYKNVALQLDIADQSKNPTTANLQSMIDDIVETGMISSVTVCCYPTRGQEILSLNGNILLTMGMDTFTINQIANIVGGCRFFCLSRQSTVYTEETAEIAHSHGWKIQTWTIDSASSAENYFLGGCDWIITNSVKPSDLT